jgi:hypothetical protein
MTDPMPPAESPAAPRKRLNTFQLLGVIMAGVIGIRRTSDRAGGVSDASTGAILGAILVFAAVGGLALYAFVHAVKRAAGME